MQMVLRPECEEASPGKGGSHSAGRQVPWKLGSPLLLSREGGRPMLVLAYFTFMTFSIWETKQVPPREKGLALAT